MTSFLKRLIRGNQPKHKKLIEDCTAGKDDVDGVAGCSGSSESDNLESGFGAHFPVKYLGSTLVATPNGHVATAEAIKAVIAMTRASGKKLQRVILTVNLRGIKVIDARSDEILYDISIYRVSFCSADASYNHVFAFVATNSNETMECHTFLCRRRKMAKNATLAIARIFYTAYELWQLSHEDPPSESSSECGTKKKTAKSIVGNKAKKDSTTGKCKSTNLRKKGSKAVEKKKVEENNTLLIDFSKELEKVPSTGKSWVSFDDDDFFDDMNKETKQTSDQDKNGSFFQSCDSIDLLRLS